MNCRSHCLRSIAVLLISFVFLTDTSGAQGSNSLKPLQFLVGTWSGIGSGKPGEAIAGSTTFSLELEGKAMMRKNRAEYPSTSGRVERTIHEDLMIIYPEPGVGTIRAIYIDNEDHVINYTASYPARQKAVIFESVASEKGPRFRLTYELGSDGSLNTEFFIAPPGGEFKSYVKGTLKKSN